MRKTTLIALLLAGLLLGTGPKVFAQSYSLQGLGQFAGRQDWQGGLSYGLGWVRADPNNPDAWYAVALAHENLGQLSGAIVAARRAVQIRPSQWAYWYPLCQSYMGMGTRVGFEALARDCAGQLQRLARADWEWFETGNVYLSLGELQPSLYRSAKGAFLQDLQLNPRASGAWQNLGNTEWHLGNLKNAEDDFRKAIQLGNTSAAQNLRMLQTEIQSCFNQKQTIAHTQYPLLGVITAYNQNCGSISGGIPVRVIPVP
ncbi:MAG TPA: tetratricopeptide repeat protein [Steroidobacteraceae bacterium]|jgi:tetratricopeptide (TPR) repeat protein